MTPCCAIAPPSPGDGVWWPMGDTRNARHQLPTQDIAGWLQTAPLIFLTGTE